MDIGENTEPTRVMHPRGFVSRPVGRSRVGNSSGPRLRWVVLAEAVHEALLVVLGDVVGGDVLDVVQGR